MLKCVIVACKSSTETGTKFIKFPSSDSPAYENWMKICYQSADIIRVHPEPYICENHFSDNSDLVNEDSIPSLYLNPIHELTDKESAISTAQQRRAYLMELVEEAVLEWSIRAHHNPSLASVCKLKSGIIPIARKILNIVDPTLEFSFNDSWWTKFRSIQTFHLETGKVKDCSNKTLNLVDIVHELYPNIEIKGVGGKADSNDKDNSKSLEDVKPNDKSQYSDVDDKVQEDFISEPNIKPELTIDSYSHALEYIKTLEDFALQQEDYRAIGMLSSLKYILQTRENSE